MIGRKERIMRPTRIRAYAAACLLSLALSGCGKVQGDAEVDTADGEGAIGHGAGLFTGKRGAFIIENDVWTGARPGDKGFSPED